MNGTDDVLPYSPDAKNECIWKEDGIEDHFGLHKFKPYPRPSKRICDTVLEAIGNTPLVKLNKIPKEFGVECDVYAKCEFLNAGGSIKDRIAVRMVEIAEECGRLKPGMTIIEPTSGNTGIGLALVSAVKGYNCIITMPSKMSKEKEVVLKALGAKIVRTPDDAPFDSPDSHIGMAFRLHKEIPNSVILDQYINCGNPIAHYDDTAEEIIQALDGKIDLAVIGAGTGGSITGIGRKLKEKVPGVKIVGVDPIGSVISNKDRDNQHGHKFQVEGIGYDFVPTVLDMDGIDSWEKTGDPETFLMARRLLREEGLLIGGSSGAIVVGAMRAAKSLKKGQRCVLLLPDGVRNYMTKFLSDDWMVAQKYMDPINYDKIAPTDEEFKKICMNGYNPELPPEHEFQKQLPSPSPSHFTPTRAILMDTILEAIGHTPMVKLNKIPQSMGIEADIFVKCEYLSAGGSVKDRIALKMVEMAEKSGHLKPGMTIIEPTSGNTGIGLALVSAVRGYRCIIVMPEKMSKEKEFTLKGLGAVIVRTPTQHGYTHPESHIGVALRLEKEIPGAIILDQYRNAGNPLAHYENTAEEILWAVEGKLDMVVIGAGTGGTVTGISKKIKEKIPTCKVVGTDPEGSILADPTNRETKAYEVEGVGYDFIPAVLDRGLVDDWIKTHDADSFYMSRRLIREEGILCGGSSGANVWAALQKAKDLKKGQRVVVVLPDGIRNYMTKFVDDDWMKSKGFPVPEYPTTKDTDLITKILESVRIS